MHYVLQTWKESTNVESLASMIIYKTVNPAWHDWFDIHESSLQGSRMLVKLHENVGWHDISVSWPTVQLTSRLYKVVEKIIEEYDSETNASEFKKGLKSNFQLYERLFRLTADQFDQPKLEREVVYKLLSHLMELDYSFASQKLLEQGDKDISLESVLEGLKKNREIIDGARKAKADVTDKSVKDKKKTSSSSTLESTKGKTASAHQATSFEPQNQCSLCNLPNSEDKCPKRKQQIANPARQAGTKLPGQPKGNQTRKWHQQQQRTTSVAAFFARV